MPSAPELLYIPGNIWIIEVLLKSKTKHSAKSDCHIRITAEIKVNLKDIAHCHDPCREPEPHLRRIERIHNISHRIRDQQLLSKTTDKPLYPCRRVLNCDTPVRKLCFNVMVFDNRSCDQLWEERNIQHQLPHILLYRILVPVHVNAIGERLKCIKGDTNRKRDPWYRQLYTKQSSGCLHQQSAVFKHNKHSDIEQHCQGKDSFRPLLC